MMTRNARRVLAVMLTLGVLGAGGKWTVVAQQALDCGLNGFCVSNSTSSLLGLPQGTLNIVTYQPWDRVVKNPAAAAWLPLEAEARAALAVLHGVANDNRLPHAALDDIRAMMFLRLLSIAQKKHNGDTLTVVEQDALDTFADVIVERRVGPAEKALFEYSRWQADPCHYTVPAGFGFEQYAPGPQCGVGGVMLSGPPRPPTKEQFTAYGAALAFKKANDELTNVKRAALHIPASNTTFTYDPSVDAEAAYRDMDEALAIATGVAGAVLVGSLATIAALTSITVASTFAAMAGSFSIFGTIASSVAIGAFSSAAAVGVGIAATVPAFVIIATVVAVVYIIQFAEDQSVLPMLQESLEKSRRVPDVWALATSEESLNQLELYATFVHQTLPSYDDERVANVRPTPPSQRQPGDPQFEVNGVVQDELETAAPDGQLQQTFMSQGWFVTRKQASAGVWMPWQWSLYLHYRAQDETHIAGIQPSGFFRLNTSSDPATNAEKVSELQVPSPAGNPRVVKWHGNHAPRLAPHVSDQPAILSPVTFTAGASDQDVGDTITGITWIIEDPVFQVPFGFRGDFGECGLTPSGGFDPTGTGLRMACNGRVFGDNGSGISHIFDRPGTFGVLVMAQDSNGAVSREKFNVVIGNVGPTLAVQTPVATVAEGQAITVTGTVNFPAVSPGQYSALTTVAVEWGDGEVTQRMYPCRFGSTVPADAECGFVQNAEGLVYTTSQPPGPWSFSFSHSYVHRADSTFPDPTQIKVYAITTLGGRSQTERFDVSVSNVPPAVVFRPVCPFLSAITCTAVNDHREVAMGERLTIRGSIFDEPLASHFVKVIWGDATSSAYTAGCTAAGCPGFGDPWPGGTGKPMDLFRNYAAAGTYPIKITVDDGGPNGEVIYSTEAIIFGVSDLTGPAEVAAGAPATFAFATTLPINGTATITPTCPGGQVSEQSSTSFTCVFNQVSAKTAAQVKLQAVIAGRTFEKTVNVDILPLLTTVSPLSGPTTVTERTTVVYSYSETHSAGGLVFYAPGCGLHADNIASVGGSSITCRFHEVSVPTTTSVSVTVSALGGNDSSELLVTVMPDTAPPTLTLPSPAPVDSTSHLGAIVSFSASATDAISGTEQVICRPAPGSQFPIGSTEVLCTARDWRENEAEGSFSVVVIDKTLPTLTLPAPMTLDASGPSGAVATFTATAIDAAPANPAVSCLPTSGSTFAFGTTAVVCRATDEAGNEADGRFNVTVQGPTQQLASLSARIQAMAIDAKLKAKLLKLLSDVTNVLPKSRPGACGQLSEFLAVATDSVRKGLTVEQLNEIVVEVNRIRAVIGC